MVGMPIEWLNILVTAPDPDAPPARAAGREPFLGHERPVAF
jgi:hypothetical protein